MTIMKVPHGLPVPNSTQSYWQTPYLGISDERTTPDLPKSAKYVIVGSGISGALIAYKLLQQEPSATIVMLEARKACSGATGRNGGHCRAGRYLDFKGDMEKYGLEEALRMETLEETTVRSIGKLVRDENIRCDLRAVETCDIVTDQKQWDELVDVVKTRNKYAANHPHLTKQKIWHGEEARKEFLVPSAVGAVTFPAYSLSPYKLVCALLHLNIAKGMNLQTTTPVLRVAKDDASKAESRWSVYTKRGVVRADRAILATNAYTAALYPALANFIIPTRGQVAAVRPGSNISGNPALKRTCGLTTSESGDYLQSRGEGLSGEGDIIVGGGRRIAKGGEQPVLDDSTIHPEISEYLTHILGKAFGRENWGKDGKVLQEWTGIMGYTKDSQPIVGEAPGQQGLWICAGFNGHGMALTFQSAEALVQQVLGHGDEVDKWFPSSYRLSRIVRE